MPYDIEMESRRKSHIRFESERLLLLPPATQHPLHRQGSRQQPYSEMGVLEPARGKIERSLQPRTAGLPVQVDYAPFAQAGILHPPQHLAGAPPVVADEPPVPGKRQPQRHHHVNENETPHSCLWGEILLLIDATAQGEEVGKKAPRRQSGSRVQRQLDSLTE